MTVDSLNELKTAFRSWRSQKRYPRERVPTELLTRAQRAVAIHGLSAVVEATQFDSDRLSNKKSISVKTPKVINRVPSYSRVEVTGPSATARPLVEAEMPSGMKLRIFQITAETHGLLTSLCGSAGAK